MPPTPSQTFTKLLTYSFALVVVPFAAYKLTGDVVLRGMEVDAGTRAVYSLEWPRWWASTRCCSLTSARRCGRIATGREGAGGRTTGRRRTEVDVEVAFRTNCNTDIRTYTPCSRTTPWIYCRFTHLDISLPSTTAGSSYPTRTPCCSSPVRCTCRRARSSRARSASCNL